MIALKKGTIAWREARAPNADEVEFNGQWVYDADGFTSLMVWDDALQNARPMTQAEIDAIPQQQLIAKRARTIGELANGPDSSMLLRGAILALIDALNAERSTVNAMLASVAAATSLADLKTRYGQIGNLATITKANTIASITNHINAGDADN